MSNLYYKSVIDIPVESFISEKIENTKSTSGLCE